MLTTILSSTLVAALVAALVSYRTNERKILVDNITQERAKWRKIMRELSNEIIKAVHLEDQNAIKLHCAELTLNVNPFDAEDRELVLVSEQLVTSLDRDVLLKEFIERMSLLLKHDWERAKREARPLFLRGAEPVRVSFNEFKSSLAIKQAVNKQQGKSKLKLFWYFWTLSFSAGVLFFLAAGLSEPVITLIKQLNDPKIVKPLNVWVEFACWSIFCGSIWAANYLWFKGSEKKFLELWFSKDKS